MTPASHLQRIKKVICYIVHGPNLLVFRQPRFPEAGLQVPAGTIEPNEPPEDAALREAEEETGLKGLRVRRKLGVYDFDMSKWKPEIHLRRADPDLIADQGRFISELRLWPGRF